MHRFYLPSARSAGDMLRLEGREAHHALDVLRLQDGDTVTVLDGAGHEFLCAVESRARASVTLSVSRRSFIAAPACAVTLLAGLPKGKIIEGIIQKATEMGVRRIVPLLTERVVARLDGESAEAKREKWQAVAVEAVKQCGAAWLPVVEAPVSLAQFLHRQERFELALVGSLQPDRRNPRELLRQLEANRGRLPETAGVWIGPEGDFTATELAAIRDSGAVPVSFGRLVLRVETAAVYCLSCLNYEFQRD